MLLYRNLFNGRIENLPWRVRLSDGSTLTNPDQWSSNPDALAAAGFEITQRTPNDDAYDYQIYLNQTKTNKLNELEIWWQNQINIGWNVPGENWNLGIDISDVTLLLGAYTLSKDAASMNLPSEVSIIDKAGQSHTFNSSTLTPLMLQYGAARANISSQYANILNSINSALTVEELNNIQIPF